MPTTIELGGTALDVLRKDIKNVHLSVYPPTGKVRISAPARMSMDTIRLFVISKLGWVRQQQKKLREQERESQREYLDRESQYVWGRRYLLKLAEEDAAPSVQICHSKLILCVRSGTDVTKREEIISDWYRRLLKTAVPSLIELWGARLRVTVNDFYVQQMKTRWGSCNPHAHTIRLNTTLATKPRECLEYIVVHEMVHLIEPTHGPKFLALMDRVMPNWRDTRELLNRLPARHERWNY